MASDTLPVIAKFMNDGGRFMWVVVVLTPIAVVRLLRLGRRLGRGEAVALAAWVAVPTVLAGVGGVGGILGLGNVRHALRWGSPDRASALVAFGISHAHNPPILALTVASGLCAWSAFRASRVARPLAQLDRRLSFATLALALMLAALTWRLELGLLALLASGLLAPMGSWTARSNERSSEASLRAGATAQLLSALGVAAAWAASAFVLDEGRLRARLALEDRAIRAAMGPSGLAHAASEGLTIPPSFFALAVPATLSCFLAALLAIRALAPHMRRSDLRTRRDLAACAGLVVLTAALLVGASWPGAFLDEYVARLPTVPRP